MSRKNVMIKVKPYKATKPVLRARLFFLWQNYVNSVKFAFGKNPVKLDKDKMPFLIDKLVFCVQNIVNFLSVCVSIRQLMASENTGIQSNALLGFMGQYYCGTEKNKE